MCFKITQCVEMGYDVNETRLTELITKLSDRYVGIFYYFIYLCGLFKCVSVGGGRNRESERENQITF